MVTAPRSVAKICWANAASPTTRPVFTSRAAQIHLAVTGASFLLLLGVNFWLDRYSAVLNNGGRWAGALYLVITLLLVRLFAAAERRWLVHLRPRTP